MALFGRDSILTSWMLLPLDSSLTVGTLQTLADHQGALTDALTEEQPGRILHEIRFGHTAVDLTLGGSRVYYGTADATSLFVMLLGELARWGGDPTVIEELLPHADRALDWIENVGDRDGDGFVEYQRGTDQGLVNQGWKDSWDGISFADGRLPTGPIALAEVQAYTYAAFLAPRRPGRGRRRRCRASRLEHQGGRPQAPVQRGVLDRRPRVVRRRVGRRQATDRQPDVQHGALPVDRDRRRRQGRCRRGPPALTRAVHRLGHPHAGDEHGPLQPDGLPQRLGVAS